MYHFVFAVPPDHTTSIPCLRRDQRGRPRRKVRSMLLRHRHRHLLLLKSIVLRKKTVNRSMCTFRSSEPPAAREAEAAEAAPTGRTCSIPSIHTLEWESTHDDDAVSQALHASQSKKAKSRMTFHMQSKVSHFKIRLNIADVVPCPYLNNTFVLCPPCPYCLRTLSAFRNLRTLSVLSV